MVVVVLVYAQIAFNTKLRPVEALRGAAYELGYDSEQLSLRDAEYDFWMPFQASAHGRFHLSDSDQTLTIQLRKRVPWFDWQVVKVHRQSI